MLLRLQTGVKGGALAEMQKPAEFVTKVGKSSEQQVGRVDFALSVHLYIVSRYIRIDQPPLRSGIVPKRLNSISAAIAAFR